MTAGGSIGDLAEVCDGTTGNGFDVFACVAGGDEKVGRTTGKVGGSGVGRFSDAVSRPEFDGAIFVWSSSRTVSFIIAPHVRQIDNVGARSRLQTGQIIAFFDSLERELCGMIRANPEKHIRIYFN
ncbi:MAG: hypothetical protein ACR2IH_05160 [Pyrinomonadaceae bacterium]